MLIIGSINNEHVQTGRLDNDELTKWPSRTISRSLFGVRVKQLAEVHAEGGGQFVNGHDGRVAQTAFEAAEVVLTEAGALLQLFLGEALIPSDARNVAADHLAHVHAALGGGLHRLCAYTIVL